MRLKLNGTLWRLKLNGILWRLKRDTLLWKDILLQRNMILRRLHRDKLL
jgi:hypothetical protein